MALAINRGNSMTQTNSSGCAPVVCPDCGGLECLCRPRFFAGQLLTDDDLKRLDYYITAKNKLHNRYLIGWGVVCGMNVVCNACDGMITVKAGYALSPCGEDIIVCNDVPVDVCSMIQKCSRKQPRDCQPAQPGVPDPCANTTEQWILSIHYDETPSRGVVPLKNTGGATCCTACACGGSSSCGCSGNGNASKSSGCSCGGTTTSPSQIASAQPQCEPTIVCETYHFEVCKVQTATPPKRPIGALPQRFLNCLTALAQLVSAPPTTGNQQDVQNWCCAIRNNLLDFFADNPGYTCSIPQKLALLCQPGADIQTIIQQVVYALANYIRDCFCAALLPPCSCPVQDASVPLATITISKKDGACRIVSICNLDVRKFATTFPNLAYWLSFLPTVRDLRQAIDGICCQPLEQRPVKFGDRAAPVPGPAVPAAGRIGVVGDPFTQSEELFQVASQAFANPKRIVDAQTLSAATLGLTDANNQPFLSPVELNHPMETLAMNGLARPFATAVVPSVLLGLLFGGRAPAAPVAPPAAPPGGPAAASPPAPPAAAPGPTKAEFDALQAELNGMKEDLKRSQDQIDKLSKRKKAE